MAVYTVQFIPSRFAALGFPLFPRRLRALSRLLLQLLLRRPDLLQPLFRGGQFFRKILGFAAFSIARILFGVYPLRLRQNLLHSLLQLRFLLFYPLVALRPVPVRVRTHLRPVDRHHS